MAGLQRNVLIVDDDKAVRDALEFAPSSQGFEVHVYSGGAELLADFSASQGPAA